MNAFLKLIFFFLFPLFPLTSRAAEEPSPTVLVIFGATGDLTAKKILPAIDQLSEKGQLPKKFAVVAVARRAEAEFRKQIRSAQPIIYHQSRFDDDQGYQGLQKLIGRIDQNFGSQSQRIYFLATPPSHFKTIVEKMDQHDLIAPTDRVLIEKPFGRDLESALALQESLSQHLDDSQIYRIDHYLGKEGVQNLIQFRLGQHLEDIWNNQHVDHVQITLSEEIGIGTRGQFWEETGFLRDVVQNHLMQLLSLVGMEPPGSIEAVPAEKIKLLNAIRPLDPKSIVRGQYGTGLIQGKEVVGYKEEKDVSPTSTAETFVSATFFIDNDRWEGVPFHIRGGKRLPEPITEIAMTFKSGEVLHIRIQPKPAIFFEDSAELPFEPALFSEAYQKLIYDSIRGDPSSFVQAEEQFAAWRLLTPVLNHWETEKEIAIYPAGTWP